VSWWKGPGCKCFLFKKNISVFIKDPTQAPCYTFTKFASWFDDFEQKVTKLFNKIVHHLGFKVILVVWKLHNFLPLFKRDIYVCKLWVLPKQCKNDEYFPTLTGFRAAGPKNLKYVYIDTLDLPVWVLIKWIRSNRVSALTIPLGWKLVPRQLFRCWHIPSGKLTASRLEYTPCFNRSYTSSIRVYFPASYVSSPRVYLKI